MNNQELYEYIKSRTYNCCLCRELQWRVVEKGVAEIERWDNMICGGVEDMQLRRDAAD